jgi:hypothetical protein
MDNKASRLDQVCLLISSLGLPAIALGQMALLGCMWFSHH